MQTTYMLGFGFRTHRSYRTLSEILIDKANEGVQVNVLIWSEMSSGEYFGENGIPGVRIDFMSVWSLV